MSRLFISIFVAAFALAVFSLSSCGGGGYPQKGKVTEGPFLPPPPPANSGTLGGTLTVENLPIGDDPGDTGDVTRATVKVIDPSEEIGDLPFANPAPDGRFALGYVPAANLKYLNLNFNTPIDLRGVGVAATPISINVPVQIADGAHTRVNATVRKYSPPATAALRSPSTDDVTTIEVEYEYEGPDGARHVKFIVNFRLGKLTLDSTGSGSYDDEDEFDDDNCDGVSNEREAEDREHREYEEVESEGDVQTISGTAITVNGIVFNVDERTTFKDGLKLSQLILGDLVKIKGYVLPGGKIYAEKIELKDSGGGDDGGEEDEEDEEDGDD